MKKLFAFSTLLAFLFIANPFHAKAGMMEKKEIVKPINFFCQYIPGDYRCEWVF